MNIKLIKCLTALLILLSGFSYGENKAMEAIPGKTITIEQLEEMFVGLKKDTKWNISGNLLWGYFFTSHEPKKLEKAKSILIAKGYRFVNLYMSDKDVPNEPDLFWLHVEKIEHHTPQSLDARNNELYILANELKLESYDGMDVGPVSN